MAPEPRGQVLGARAGQVHRRPPQGRPGGPAQGQRSVLDDQMARPRLFLTPQRSRLEVDRPDARLSSWQDPPPWRPPPAAETGRYRRPAPPETRSRQTVPETGP